MRECNLMKLNRKQLQLILALSDVTKPSYIDYFVFNDDNELIGIQENSPLLIQNIFNNYKKILIQRSINE